jgi:hypothetical protein
MPDRERQNRDAPPATVYMIVDPATREAFRLGEGPAESGPLIFTSRERLEAYAQEAGVGEYTVIEVSGMALARMRSKPHWVDGECRG